MIGTPTDAEIFRLALEGRLGDVHVSLPGEIVRVDLSAQVVDVRPTVQRALASSDPDGADVLEDLPVIPSVPFLFPRAGGFVITFPVQVGDTVLLVFGERDPAQWRRTGQLAPPGDRRLHSLAHAVALLGYYPAAEAITEVSDTALELRTEDGSFRVRISGSDIQINGAGDAASLASKVDRVVDAIVNTVISPGDGGAAIKAAVAAAKTTNGGTVASGYLKVGA